MAREMVNLQEQLRKLHPANDDCPSPCRFRYEERQQPTDLPDFCQQCEVRKQIEFYEEAFELEVARRFPEGIRWSFDSLSADVVRVKRIDKQLRGKGYPRGCDLLTAQLLDILRSEDYRPLRIMRWEADQKARKTE